MHLPYAYSRKEAKRIREGRKGNFPAYPKNSSRVSSVRFSILVLIDKLTWSCSCPFIVSRFGDDEMGRTSKKAYRPRNGRRYLTPQFVEAILKIFRRGSQ